MKLSIIILIALSFSVFSDKGEVVKRTGSCDWFLVETNRGLVLLEWYGGNDPDEGDMIVGNLSSYGMKDLYNTTDDAELRVWLEDYMMSEDGAIEDLYEECE
jgi:hypothetical protein